MHCAEMVAQGHEHHKETLKTCLNGVTTALRAVADSDYTAALAALRSVDIPCEKAYALF